MSNGITGLESCQCRLNRSQRNHILCCMLVWLTLATMAQQKNQTLYQVKSGLFKDFLMQQLRTPLTVFWLFCESPINIIHDNYNIKVAEILSDNGSEFGVKFSKIKHQHPVERLLIELGIIQLLFIF